MSRAKATHTVSIVVVEGRGEFPIDMMRYDSCCPATEMDSGIISRTFVDTSGPPSHPAHTSAPAKVRIALRAFHPVGNQPATHDRWQRGYGWEVIWTGTHDQFQAAEHNIRPRA